MNNFQAYVAAVVDVDIDAQGVHIPRVDYAVDSGQGSARASR